jgi:mitogen-activated protein kinase kinase
MSNQDVPDAMQKLRIDPPGCAGAAPAATQLSSDIQARILAFQQRRTQPQGQSPPQPSQPPNQHRNLLPQPPQSKPPLAPQGKPLPPVPSMRALSSNNAAQANPNAIPRLKEAPPVSHGLPPSAESPPAAALALPAAVSGAAAPPASAPLAARAPGVKPSLSQRRGMKLDMGSLNAPTATAAAADTANLSALKTTGEISRRLSDRKRRPNLKLGLNGDAKGADEAAAAPAADAPDKKKLLQGLFANYLRYVDIKSGSLNFSGKASLHSKGVDFLSGSSFRILLEELEFIEELGRGNYGTVLKVLHKPTGVLMAMKEVRLELDETKFTQILMELDILHKCNLPYIVDFYGAFFVEGAVYMCMEYMDGGLLDKVCAAGEGVQLEAALAYILESVIRGLKELKDSHNIIHRDVKPTNILVNTLGKVKLCDFGVSGNLVASLAKTNIGCQSYMAPERIKLQNPDDLTYLVQLDIWLLGLTILEVAAGHYPYPPETYGNIFLQLSAIVDGEPPKLDPKKFLREAQMFVKLCLNKNPDLRPSYAALLSNPWLVKYRDVDPQMDVIVSERVRQLDEEKAKRVSRSNLTTTRPSLAGAPAGASNAPSGALNAPSGPVPAASGPVSAASGPVSAASVSGAVSGASGTPGAPGASGAGRVLPGAAGVPGAMPLPQQGRQPGESVRLLLKDRVRAPALHRRVGDRKPSGGS